MNTDNIKREMNRLLSQLGEDYEATLILRNTKDSTSCKVVTTEIKVINVVDTIIYLSKKNREAKEKLS